MAPYHIVEIIKGSCTEVLHVRQTHTLTTELHLQLMIVNILLSLSHLYLYHFSYNFVLKDELVDPILTAFLTGKSIANFVCLLVS